MEKYQNEKGEEVVIKDMQNSRLIYGIAKYAILQGKDSELVKALTAEALRRLPAPTKEE